MLTKKDYCDYNTCVALREVGCRIETEWYIHQPSYERGSCYLCFGIPRETSVLDECDYIPRLSLYEAQKWLREKGIFVYIDVPWKTDDGLGWSYFCCNKPMTEEDKEVCFASGGFYDSYEEALIEGIKASVKILKEK